MSMMKRIKRDMQTMLRSKVTLLFMTLGLLIAVPAVALAQDAGDPTGTPSPAPLGPTIQSDKEDYPPADTVILTGSGWQPGETVNINVNDDEGQTWNRNVDVIADENGNVREEFVLPDWFVATYSVTATGSSGSTATSTFTDAVLPARGCVGPPTGILVTTTADDFDLPATVGGGCSLREAISAANADPVLDTIILPQGDYTLTRSGANENDNSTGDLDVLQSLRINGSGARATNIQAGTNNSNGIGDRVLHVRPFANLSLNGATVRYGHSPDDGGGIKNDWVLSLTNVAITDNQASTQGGGISFTGPGSLNIINSTIRGNAASGAGGGLSSENTAQLTNVTITGNTAASGGGVFTTDDNFTLINATLSHNSALGGSNIARVGNIGTVTVRNTIFSDGIGGANCTVPSQKPFDILNSLDSGTSCGFESKNGSQSNANANLGALANNGGPTDTRALAAQSAAIDAGSAGPTSGAPSVDQRNLPRPKDGDGNGTALLDIGAYELQAPLNAAPATTVPTYTPASPKTSDVLQASTTTSDANANNVSVAWVWKVTHGANTCQVKTDTSAAAAPGARASSLDLSQSYTTSTCTGASPPASINPSKGDTVIVEATPNDGTVNGTMQSKSVVIANAAPTCATTSLATDEDTTGSASPDCTDTDADTLTYSIVDQGTKGTASVTGDQLQYEPDTDANGDDSFTYKANDATAESNAATVRVTINSINDAPTTPGAITSTQSLTNDGAFQLDWEASTDDVEGDDVTYTLEKMDSDDDPNWSEVASGLTSASYTFGGTNPVEDEGTWDYRVKAVDSPAGAESDYSTAENLVKVDKSGPNAPTLSFNTSANQSLKATVSGVDWYKDSALIDVADNGDKTLADGSDGSGVDAASLLPNPFSVSTNGKSAASRKVSDNATNESDASALQVNVDAANPTLGNGNCPTAGPFILNSGGGTQSVTITASDGESGVDDAASTLSGSVNTGTVGEKTVTFKAVDHVGHEVTKECNYNVNYDFGNGSGGSFSEPVRDTELNQVKAGAGVPVKFGLGGDFGLSIFATGYPTSKEIACNTGLPIDPIEETATITNSGLKYDAAAGHYVYGWKTDKTWSGTCRELNMKLADGTDHPVKFQFK
jgi:CSLREA domain-containing protein